MEKDTKINRLMNKVLPAAQKFQNNIIISSIMKGMMGAMPVLMTSAVLQLIYNFPIPAWIELLQRTGLFSLFGTIVTICNMLVLFMGFGIAYAFAEKKGCDPLIGGFVGLISILIVTPLMETVTEYGSTFSISVDALGAQGLFAAIIVSLCSTALYCFFVKKNIVIKLPDAVPEFVSKSFAGIPACLLSVAPFIIVRGLFALTPFGSLNAFIYGMIQAPLVGLGNTLPAHLLCIFLVPLFWWFGIHGTMVVFSVMMIVWQAPMIENIQAVAQGLPAPHILSMVSFFLIVQFLGGPGCLFGLYMNTLLFAKSERYKAHKKLSVIPGMFNIIEPAVYGMPIAYNPLLFVPFTLTPVLIYVLYYLLASAGIIGIPTVMLSIMVVPGPIAGFLLGGGISLGIFILLALLLTCVIYFPFFRAMDNQALKEEKELAEKEAAEAAATEEDTEPVVVK